MNSERTPAIEFRNVSISFDDIQALQNISFTLQRGEMICLTGDSDSGKSVLLRLALGFLRPDEGEILINGQDITAMEEDDLLALRRETMGMVFQDNSFFSGQTVYENTAYRLGDRSSTYASSDDGSDPRRARCGRSLAAESQNKTIR